MTDLVPGRVRVVDLGRGSCGQPREGLVLLDLSGTPRAYWNRCRHLPIPLDASTGEYLSEDRTHLLCSTHGALYRLSDGYCVEGPCSGERLVAIPIRIERGTIYLESEAAASWRAR